MAFNFLTREKKSTAPTEAVKPARKVDAAAVGIYLEGARNLAAASRRLAEMVGNFELVEAMARDIRDLEIAGDAIARAAFQSLVAEPQGWDPRLAALIKGIDDALDAVELTAARLALYHVIRPTGRAQKFSQLLASQGELLEQALAALGGHDPGKVGEAAQAIKQKQQESSVLLRETLAELLRDTTDAILLLKWKDIYEGFDAAAARFGDTANALLSLAG